MASGGHNKIADVDWICKRCGCRERYAKGECKKCALLRCYALRATKPKILKQKIIDEHWQCRKCGCNDKSFIKSGVKCCVNCYAPKGLPPGPKPNKPNWKCRICNGTDNSFIKSGRKSCINCYAPTGIKRGARRITNWACKNCGGTERYNNRKCKNCFGGEYENLDHAKKRKLRDEAMVNLTFLQLADELGKLTNE